MSEQEQIPWGEDENLGRVARIHEREQERERENPTATDIRAEIAEIAKIDVRLAESYAADRGISWKPGGDNE